MAELRRMDQNSKGENAYVPQQAKYDGIFIDHKHVHHIRIKYMPDERESTAEAKQNMSDWLYENCRFSQTRYKDLYNLPASRVEMGRNQKSSRT